MQSSWGASLSSHACSTPLTASPAVLEVVRVSGGRCKGHRFPLCAGAPPAAQDACWGGHMCPRAAAQLRIFLSRVEIFNLRCSSWWVSLPFPYSLLLCWLHQLTVACGDSGWLNTFCTGSSGPCSGEIGAALLSEADHSDVTCQGPPSMDELGFPPAPRLSASSVAFKVAFLILSCKEEHDVMTITLFSYPPTLLHPSLACPLYVNGPEDSCPVHSFHHLHGLLSLTFPSISTGQCRTEKNCGSLSSAFFPQQLVAASFSENCKKITMTSTGMKSVSVLHLAEETAQKTQSGSTQPWEPSESGGRMPVLRDAVCVPGWVGHRCLRDSQAYIAPTLSSLCEWCSWV